MQIEDFDNALKEIAILKSKHDVIREQMDKNIQKLLDVSAKTMVS